MKMGREEDKEELSLELSIGGKYGKAVNLKEKATDFCEEQRRREIQRQEARRKKWRGVNVDDKMLVEAQRFKSRAADRESREEEDWFLERKNGENWMEEVADGLGESEKKRREECLWRKVQITSPVMECDSECSNGVKSSEQCSSVVSDHHSISRKGESSSDGGSHVDSWPGAAETVPNPSSNPPPDWLPRMPCVSATGNGPNGRRVTGFLYRYNKAEVSIMCVCHGSSFSPAGFVEHAGAVDVAHPLRYITVAPFGPHLKS